jgi:outer membrane protein TolC
MKRFARFSAHLISSPAVSIATALALVFVLGSAPSVRAQGGGSGGGQQQSRAQQIPLTGRQAQQSGNVNAQQSTNPGGSSVNTSTTTIQVQGAYQGSVQDPNTAAYSNQLTLGAVIARGLRYNLGAVSASANLRQARGQKLAALSALMPLVNANISENVEKVDLQTLGFSASTFAGLSGATGGGTGGATPSIPTTVGPFHYYDARATVNYNVLDFTSIYNLRQARASVAAAELSDKDSRELVVLAVSSSYLKILADIALVQAQEAQVKYAQASYDQASAQNTAGTKSQVDTERSQVELQTEQQRLSSLRADLQKQVRVLERMVGMPLDAQPTFQETLPYNPEPPMALDAALKRALADRPDLKAAEQQLRAAEASSKAAHAEHLPTVGVNGYFGVQGVNPNHGNGVYSGTASVSIPIFQGGRIRGDEEQAKAAVEQRRAEYADQQGVVELDLRNAYLDFDVATEQVKVAQSNRDLALNTLKQSQDRFVAGVTTSVEVVQSQEALAAADRDYINSLYAHNVAKISLARAMGQAEAVIPNLLKGQAQ